MKERVLVTGAPGQLGAAVARALAAEGASPVCLVRSLERADALAQDGIALIQGDLTEPDSLPAAMEGVSDVIHLAGVISYEEADRAWLERVNVGGTRHLLDAASAAGVRRLVYTSSIATLGWVEGDGVGDEDSVWNWGAQANPYFETKRVAEDLVLSEDRLETVALCPGIVLGAGDIYRHGAAMLERLARREVPGFPPGATTVANLQDVVRGHLAALSRGRPGHRYVLGGSPVAFGELFARLAVVVGTEAPSRRLSPTLVHLLARAQSLVHTLGGPAPRLSPALARIVVRNRRYSSARAEAELGYAPQPLEVGARECWAWLLAQPGA